MEDCCNTMLKEASMKNLELEMYEKRLTNVEIEMEKTRRRMVALRTVDDIHLSTGGMGSFWG